MRPCVIWWFCRNSIMVLRDHTADFSDSNLWVLVMRTFSIFLELQSYSFGSKTTYFGLWHILFKYRGKFSHILQHNSVLFFLRWNSVEIAPCSMWWFYPSNHKVVFVLEFPQRKVVLLRCNSKSLLGWWRKSFSFFTQKYRLS